MPVSAVAFVLAAVAAISLPPTGGFMAKELIFEGALEGHHILVLVLLAFGAILNVAVFSKVVVVLFAQGEIREDEPVGACMLSALAMGIVAVGGGFGFMKANGLVSGIVGAHEPDLLSNVWHFSFLTVVSLAVYTLGFLMYAKSRSGGKAAAESFDALMTSPALGPALRMAEEKKLDPYEIGLKVVEFITRLVFRYIERMIDVVGNGIIGIGRWLMRPILSGAHNGVYSNYLCWTVVGFVVVLFILFSSAL
jgi:NADH:ubiquinone oxidoreductase subunit 5 (subunit L)/multisubunit Na+/H+ antiporter MnhA subunit